MAPASVNRHRRRTLMHLRGQQSSDSGSSGLAGAWESVVASMRSKSPSLQAILRSGYLMRADGR